jgi:hypothetical protein
MQHRVANAVVWTVAALLVVAISKFSVQNVYFRPHCPAKSSSLGILCVAFDLSGA